MVPDGGYGLEHHSRAVSLLPGAATSYPGQLRRSVFMLIAIRRHYLRCFERFAGLPCGAARCLPLRSRLATTERRHTMPGDLIRLSRLQLIARISPNNTSHSLICETRRAGVKLPAVNKWNSVFAA
jgi:hypothetical protein